jgi:hypothetical protein
VVIEVGLAYGSSALAMGEALCSIGGADVSHVVIDPFQATEDGKVGLEALHAAGLATQMTFIGEASSIALSRLAADGFTADVRRRAKLSHFENDLPIRGVERATPLCPGLVHKESSTMKARAAVLALACIVNAASRTGAQRLAEHTAKPLPRTEAAIGAWDVAIVRRAAAMIESPAQWNRSDASPCTSAAKSISLRCALERAVDGMADRAPTQTQRADCRFSTVQDRVEGSCGTFFDEATVFSIARAKAITTGVWRADAAPSEVWAGRMVNAGDPVLQQARKLVDAIAPGKYRTARLAQFNDDSTVTFANLQEYFRALEDRVRSVTAADVAESADGVEIELYAGGDGVIRTYNGWYAVSAFSAKDSTVRFQVDTTRQIAPNALDREIVKRADALLSSDSVWNRADNRKCAPDAKKWSIYCALEHATREVTGGFHHRRPALEIVRVIVEERTKGRKYNHRLMDYNNDASTHLADVRSLFAAALDQMK